MIEGHFVFVVCQPGGEPFLKDELARVQPSWRLAFSRPGFVTFKSPAPLALDLAAGSVFARAYGLSFAQLDGVGQLSALVAGGVKRGQRASLAVFARGVTSFAEQSAEARAHVDEVRTRLLAWGVPELTAEPPRAGELVIDVAVAQGEAPWLGAHLHGSQHACEAGGLLAVEMPRPPDQAPSRAYLKLEEAVIRFGLQLEAGQTALELGSAPGGASYALLRRGLTVIGVDPGEMDPRVTAFGPRFTHLRIPAGALRRESLPKPVHWLVVDMNLAPRVALKYLQRVAGPLRRSALGCIVTLKLNDRATAREIPALLELVRATGFTHVQAHQLPSNHQEICVVGLRGAT